MEITQFHKSCQRISGKDDNMPTTFRARICARQSLIDVCRSAKTIQMKRNLSSSKPNLLCPTAVSSNLHGTYQQQYPHLRPDSNPTSNIQFAPSSHQTNIPNSLNINNHSSIRQPRIVQTIQSLPISTSSYPAIRSIPPPHSVTKRNSGPTQRRPHL